MGDEEDVNAGKLRRPKRPTTDDENAFLNEGIGRDYNEQSERLEQQMQMFFLRPIDTS